ncbi:hypothetical protein EHYA_10027 [Embleya hyalina]|uniref:Uncharacterized protein n=1 Tax=Embleya hyalina TaxID=516124 RepID=A0A401Z5W0_9ACTN|nr:hypothetical protein EHYA_10027 [Embleya hyalina]
MTFPRRRGLTERAATAAVDQACRMLRLPTIRSRFPEHAESAAREQMSYLGSLSELLMAECDDRARRRSERRIQAAGAPGSSVPDGEETVTSTRLRVGVYEIPTKRRRRQFCGYTSAQPV